MSEDDPSSLPNKTVVTVVRSPAKPAEDRDACLVVIYGDDMGRRIPLGTGPMTLGRSSSCDVQIDQESVSRNHCRVSFDGKRYVVQDLGSTNGTYVNDELVEEQRLKDGDQIKVGRTILKFITGGNIEGQYHEEIYRLMTVDGLTELHNKRFFEEAIEKEVSRSQRYTRELSLVLFDIDFFKRINDTYGHLAGDAVLRQLGTIVRGRLRSHDIAARVGGEEFAILLPEVDRAGAVKLAEELRRLVQQSIFRFEGVRIDVTISLGVTEWSTQIGNVESFIRTADEKLYEAKRRGRNRVVS